MFSFWLLFLALPTVLEAACNHVHVNGELFATGICFFNRRPKQWWKFVCGGAINGTNSSTTQGQLLTYPESSPGCGGVGTPLPVSNAVWTCGGSTCGFTQIDNCNVPITNASQHQTAHPFSTCVSAPIVNSTNQTTNLAASYIYECCTDMKTVQQLNYVGTNNCQGGPNVSLISEFRYTESCLPQINLVYDQVLQKTVMALPPVCVTTVHCHPISVPTSQPTNTPTISLSPTQATTTTNTPGSSTTAVPGNGTTAPASSSMSPGMNTTAATNGTNTTAAGHGGGGGQAASKKKVNVALIVGLCVAFVLILCLGIAFYVWRQRTKPGHSLNWDAYSSQNAYEPLHQDTPAAQSQEDAP